MQQRIVIDTSVMISALIGKRGPARETIRRGLKQEFLPLISNPLFQEYESLTRQPRILRQCPLNEHEIRDLLNAWYNCCQWVSIYYLWRPNLPDEADNFLFELAVSGNAGYILTQNIRDLRPELCFPDIQVLTPAQYLRGEY